MESCEFETFRSVLELVRDEPAAVIDDSSFDKIVDSLYEVCKADGKYLDSVFQSVSCMEEILKQLAINVNSKAAAFGIRLLEISIVFQKVPYQHTTSLLRNLLTANSQPNVVCAALSVLKAMLNSCNGLCWLLEEKLHLLVINQLAISSYFVARTTEDVIHCMILGCAEQIVDKNSSSHELCKKCLNELATYLDTDLQSTIVPFTTLIRILSHLITSGLSAEALQYLFDTYWPFDKWFAQFAIRKAEECHAVLNLFETCIKTHWTTLLRPFLSDDSIVLGHASSLCGRGMIPVAMRLLMLTVSLPSLNGVNPNQCYYQLLLYPLSVFLQEDDDRVNFPTDDHKVMVASVRQFLFDHTEQALLSTLKCVKYIMKMLGSTSDWWARCLELCINLLETCANRSTEVQYKLSTSSQHKLITEVLVILSEDDNYDHLKIVSLSLTKQLASSLAAVVQKRSFPLQIVCKSLYLIGQVLTTLLQPAVGVAAGGLSTSGCGLLSSIVESLQLCSMDINWEVRDSCIELIGSLAHDQTSDGMIQFLSSSKLCEVLVTHGLVDVEPCVKASTILSLSSVVTNPPLAKVFMQQRSDKFSNHLNAAHTVLEFTDVSLHETTVRLNAWRAFNIVCTRNSELLALLTDGNDSLYKLSTHLSQGIADDNWEIKAEVMETLLLIYQSLVTRQSSIPDYVACCSSQDHNTHDSKCHVLDSLNFFPVLKEAITDYHVEVKKKAEELIGMLQRTPHNCDCRQCKKCILEISGLCCSNSTVQEKCPQEIFLDVLQEILMAAKCEENELRETDCY